MRTTAPPHQVRPSGGRALYHTPPWPRPDRRPERAVSRGNVPGGAPGQGGRRARAGPGQGAMGGARTGAVRDIGCGAPGARESAGHRRVVRAKVASPVIRCAPGLRPLSGAHRVDSTQWVGSTGWAPLGGLHWVGSPDACIATGCKASRFPLGGRCPASSPQPGVGVPHPVGRRSRSEPIRARTQCSPSGPALAGDTDGVSDAISWSHGTSPGVPGSALLASLWRSLEASGPCHSYCSGPGHAGGPSCSAQMSPLRGTRRATGHLVSPADFATPH
ncbi:hypothetical protein GA0115254_123812 [Streptomyces sp. Ncost-T10-10d]|nr:hypothetical protein GA0115254_123812 [Streptomyces sp. Ncost-T10-10d]